MFRVISRKRRIELPRFARAIVSGVAPLLLASPAFAQIGGDRVSSFLSNALSYAQSLGIFGAGFLVIWAVANIARERPSGKQWAGAGGEGVRRVRGRSSRADPGRDRPVSRAHARKLAQRRARHPLGGLGAEKRLKTSARARDTHDP